MIPYGKNNSTSPRTVTLIYFCFMPGNHYSYESLLAFTKAIFQKIGCPEKDAALAAKVLLSADLRGIDSHGVARLSGYVRLWEKKRINATPNIRIVHETATTAT